jgi:hypothetical protein
VKGTRTGYRRWVRGLCGPVSAKRRRGFKLVGGCGLWDGPAIYVDVAAVCGIREKAIYIEKERASSLF